MAAVACPNTDPLAFAARPFSVNVFLFEWTRDVFFFKPVACKNKSLHHWLVFLKQTPIVMIEDAADDSSPQTHS